MFPEPEEVYWERVKKLPILVADTLEQLPEEGPYTPKQLELFNTVTEEISFLLNWKVYNDAYSRDRDWLFMDYLSLSPKEAEFAILATEANPELRQSELWAAFLAYIHLMKLRKRNNTYVSRWIDKKKNTPPPTTPENIVEAENFTKETISPEKRQRIQNCTICATLPDKAISYWSAYLGTGIELPTITKELLVVGKPYYTRFHDESLKQCPECATSYDWQRNYEYPARNAKDEIILTRLNTHEGHVNLQKILQYVHEKSLVQEPFPTHHKRYPTMAALAHQTPISPEKFANILKEHQKFIASGGANFKWDPYHTSFEKNNAVIVGVYQIGKKKTKGKQADLTHQRLDGLPLSGIELTTAYMAGVVCHDQDLSGINLSHSLITDSDFSSVNFQNANLSGVDFSRSDLLNCDFRNANLKYADLEWVNLSGSDLRGANLGGAKMKGVNLENITVG